MSHIIMNQPQINSTSITTPNSISVPMTHPHKMSSTETTFLTPTSQNNSNHGEKQSIATTEKHQPIMSSALPQADVQRKIPNSHIIRDRGQGFAGDHHRWNMDHETYKQWTQVMQLWLNKSTVAVSDYMQD